MTNVPLTLEAGVVSIHPIVLWISLGVNLALVMTIGVMALVAKKRKAQAAAKLDKVTQETNRQQTAFIANMTHEIRTPLNAIVGFTDMLAEMEDLDHDTRMEFRKEIDTNKDSLLQIVNDLIDYSKIESNTFDYNDTEVDVNALIDEICTRENGHAHPNGIQVQFSEKMPQCRLRVDRKRFSQVVGNLVRNALKFTEKGSVNVGSKRLKNGTFYFYVKDTGCGIDEEARKAIFERFVKMNYNIKGTGLGLSIAKSIVEHYGGGIGVESKKGEGSTFYFTMPTNTEYKEYGRF